jgi:hypothetical protein
MLGELISLGVGVLGLAATVLVTWGVQKTRFEVLQEKVQKLESEYEEKLQKLQAELERSRQSQGARVGRLERWRAFLEGTTMRHHSRAVPIMKDEGDGEDDSSAIK